MLRKNRLFSVAVILVLIASLTNTTAMATNGNLPGGTSISVDITAPPDGVLVASPAGDVTIKGTASIGQGLPLPNTLIVYVLDVSGSTINGFSGTGCGGDQNGDTISDTVLDCEIAATKALNTQAIALGTVGEVGVVAFARLGATGDVGPAAGDQLLTGPATDADALGGIDVEQVLSSLDANISPAVDNIKLFTPKKVDATSTDYVEALKAANAIISASTKTQRMIVFLSDGFPESGLIASVSVPSDVSVFTFAVGTKANCANTVTNPLFGSLNEVAALGDGKGFCTNVTDTTTLPGILPGIIKSSLFKLTKSVDGEPEVDITALAVPALPLAGPANTTFTFDVLGLAPGKHEVCTKAYGTDAGGEGSVQECIQVVAADISLEPATATNELGTPGQTHTVTAKVAAGADGGVPNVAVTISIVSGPNSPFTATGLTDANGEFSLTYTALQGLAGEGTDAIKACFTDGLGFTLCDTAEKIWQDTTPPEVSCPESGNPHGIVPRSHNEDGFFKLLATDLVDPNPKIFLLDPVSGTVFGPFPDGTTIKYTQAPGGPPSQKKIGSSSGKVNNVSTYVNWHIKGRGDALVYGVDASGNESAKIQCLVPPPPK